MHSSSSKPSRKALRNSLLLPFLIVGVVLVAGVILFEVAPESQFNPIFGILLGLALLVFLIYWTRHANWQLRLLAVLFATPAMAGITAGVLQGRSRFIVIGVGLTFLLLVVQRAFSVPTSYRFAARQFDLGNYEQALRLINKSIESRPEFAESYQLRALIRTTYKQFGPAEKDAQQAISLRPEMPTHHHTLGQIYLAESRYEEALAAFQSAAQLDDSKAMYHFYKGLAALRLQKFDEAAEAFSMATRKTLPLIEYDILAHFYLYQALLATKRPSLAQTTLETMHKFADGVPRLQAMVAEQADYEHIRLLRQDVAEIEKLMREV